MNYEQQLDRVLDIQQAIPMDGSISVLTGRNGSGKSLVRKLLSAAAKKYHKKQLVHASMELRTGSSSGFGAFLQDRSEMSTSSHTAYLMQTACKSLHGGFLCIDEVEIGLGEETILGSVEWLNANLKDYLKDTLGCLVITHSRLVVQNLKFDHWFSLDGFDTPYEWLQRPIVPTDLTAMRENDVLFFRHVLKFIEEGKKGK